MWTHFYLCQSRHHIWRRAGGWLPGPLLDRSRNFVPTLRVSQRTWSELNFSSQPTIYPAEKKVPTFLSVVGGTTYGLLHNLLAPASPKDKSFKEIVDTLKAHFEPKPLMIAERFHFHRRNQNSGESVAMYVAELQRLATHCAYEAYLEVASYPGSRWTGKERAWYPLFAHALNFPEILGNQKLLCYIRKTMTT